VVAFSNANQWDGFRWGASIDDVKVHIIYALSTSRPWRPLDHRLLSLAHSCFIVVFSFLFSLETAQQHTAVMISRTSSILRTATTYTHTPIRLSLARTMSTTPERLVLVDRQGPVTVLTLNRPKALNALSSPLFEQLNAELDVASKDDQVKCIVLTGGEKVFAGQSYPPRAQSPRLVYLRNAFGLAYDLHTAGADIKEMKDKNFAEVYKSNFLGSWAQVTTLRKPIVGAVSGYAVSDLPSLFKPSRQAF
jgi:hypothetical protein